MDINTDLSCGRAKNPDMVLRAALARMSPWPKVAAQPTQIGITQVVGCPSNPNMAPGGDPDPKYLHGPWWQQ